MNEIVTAQPPSVSIVIPVFNDAERLDLCLGALARQTYPDERYEVIVVDNGSTPPVAKLLAGRHTVVRWTSEAAPGSYAARNRGIALAGGEVIAFTDSDCLPVEDWIERGVGALLSIEHCGLVAGCVETFVTSSAAPNIAEVYDLAAAFPQQEYVERWHFGATANIFTTAAVIKVVGPFNAAMTSGGDSEWGRRVHAAGYRQMYSAATRVRHPARSSLRALIAKRRRLAGGVCLLHRNGDSAIVQRCRRALLVVATRIIPLPGHYAALWRNVRVSRCRKRWVLIALHCVPSRARRKLKYNPALPPKWL